MKKMEDDKIDLVSSTDEDSDEDLPSITFSKKDVIQKPIKTVNQIRTPRKGVKPNEPDASPFNSPSLSATCKGNRKIKSTVSISELLKEKRQDDNILNKVKDIMEMEKREVLPPEEDGGDVMIDADKVKEEDDFQDFSQDFSQDVNESGGESSDDAMIASVEGMMSKDYSDTFPGRELFGRPAVQIEEKIFLEELTKYRDGDFIGINTEELENEDLLSSEELHELFIQLLEDFCYIPTLPDEICKIVWRISYCVQSFNVSYCASKCLAAHFESKENKGTGWRPTLDNFLESIITLGAKPYIVAAIRKVYPLIDMNRFAALDCSGEEQFLNSRSIRKTFHGRLYNFESIIKIFTKSIQTFPLVHAIDELTGLLVLAFNLSVDKVIQLNLFDIKILVGSILDAYSDTQWKDEMRIIISKFLSFDWHHRDILHCIECIPPTERGLKFQQLLSVNVAINFVSESTSIIQTFPVSLHTLSKLISYLEIDDEDNADYFQMSTILHLINICSKSDFKCVGKQMDIVKAIINKLTHLNDQIKECMGRHMDRTKLKNQIILLKSKYEIITKNSEALINQSHLDSYFGKQKANNEDNK